MALTDAAHGRPFATWSCERGPRRQRAMRFMTAQGTTNRLTLSETSVFWQKNTTIFKRGRACASRTAATARGWFLSFPSGAVVRVHPRRAEAAWAAAVVGTPAPQTLQWQAAIRELAAFHLGSAQTAASPSVPHPAIAATAS